MNVGNLNFAIGNLKYKTSNEPPILGIIEASGLTVGLVCFLVALVVIIVYCKKYHGKGRMTDLRGSVLKFDREASLFIKRGEGWGVQDLKYPY